jgi:mannose-6-phosphate isomerase-like protein (cupin superfamily)
VYFDKYRICIGPLWDYLLLDLAELETKSLQVLLRSRTNPSSKAVRWLIVVCVVAGLFSFFRLFFEQLVAFWSVTRSISFFSTRTRPSKHCGKPHFFLFCLYLLDVCTFESVCACHVHVLEEETEALCCVPRYILGFEVLKHLHVVRNVCGLVLLCCAKHSNMLTSILYYFPFFFVCFGLCLCLLLLFKFLIWKYALFDLEHMRAVVSHSNSGWERGLRNYFEYRDLGIKNATNGRFAAHVIRPIKGEKQLSINHRHDCDFQMVYVLQGWVKFLYEGSEVVLLEKGSCVFQPSSIVHREIEHSDDLEMLVNTKL